MSAKKVNKLKPRIGELSTVPAGKQGLPYLFTKEAEVELDELLQIVAEGEIENEEDLLELMEKQKLSPKAINAVKGAMRLLGAHKDVIPADMMKKLSAMAGYGYPAPTSKQEEKPEEKPEEEPANKGKGEGGMKKAKEGDRPAFLKEDGSIDFDALPENVVPLVQHLKKEHDEAAAANDSSEEIKKLQDDLAEERRIRKEREFKDKVKDELGNLAGDADELGKMLKEAYDVSEELGEKVWGNLKKQDEALGKNDLLLKEIGSAGGETGEGYEGHEKLVALAKEYQKADPELTFEQAYEKAFEANPEHYASFAKEKRKRQGAGDLEVN